MSSEQLKRKTSTKTRLWHPDYIASSMLHRDLASLFPELNGRLLDLGCGNSPYRDLLENITSYVAYDIDKLYSKPSVVGNASVLPFASESFDSVLSTQVLEHVAEPWKMLEEISRVLLPGGKLLLSAPQYWRLHEKPHDYYRYTRYGLVHLLQKCGLIPITCRNQGGALALLAQGLLNTIWHNTPKKYSIPWWMGKILTTLINTITFSIDGIYCDREDTMNYVVLAVKKS